MLAGIGPIRQRPIHINLILGHFRLSLTDPIHDIVKRAKIGSDRNRGESTTRSDIRFEIGSRSDIRFKIGYPVSDAAIIHQV